MKVEKLEGTRDFYPPEMRFRNWLFQKMRYVSELYGYEEFDGPFLEKFDLYAAKSGEELANEQTYVFNTRGENPERIAVRPEMTPTLARMVAAKQNELRKPLRWFTIPNVWRYERAQRGRKREFYQWNIDILGVETMDADAEILAVSIALLASLGLQKGEFVVRLSNRYYLEDLLKRLGVDLSLKEGVYRQIDRIEKLKPEDFRANLQELGLSAETVAQLEQALRERNYQDFGPLKELWERLEDYGIADYVEFDPSIVRGLLYYTGTVFEVWDPTKKFTRAIMGGGRYDGLVEVLGGQPLPAVGTAISDVVLEEMLKQQGKMPKLERELDVFVARYSPNERRQSIAVAQQLRQAGLKVELGVLGNSMDKQLKAANNSGAKFAVIVAPAELERGEVNLKNLQTRAQQTVKLEALVAAIQNEF